MRHDVGNVTMLEVGRIWPVAMYLVQRDLAQTDRLYQGVMVQVPCRLSTPHDAQFLVGFLIDQRRLIYSL